MAVSIIELLRIGRLFFMELDPLDVLDKSLIQVEHKHLALQFYLDYKHQ